MSSAFTGLSASAATTASNRVTATNVYGGTTSDKRLKIGELNDANGDPQFVVQSANTTDGDTSTTLPILIDAGSAHIELKGTDGDGNPRHYDDVLKYLNDLPTSTDVQDNADAIIANAQQITTTNSNVAANTTARTTNANNIDTLNAVLATLTQPLQ